MGALFVSMPGDLHLVHAFSTPSLVLDTGRRWCPEHGKAWEALTYSC